MPCRILVGALVCVLCFVGRLAMGGDAGVGLFVSPQGDDGAHGTAEAPLRTIAAALGRAEAGTTVTLTEGVYKEAVTFQKSGEQGKPISLVGQGKVVIDVSGNAEDRLAIVGRGVGFIVVEGIEVTGHVQGLKFKDCHDITVRKCKVYHGEVGLSLEGSFARKMLFEDIELAEHQAGGMDVSDGVAMEDVTVRRCSAHENHCKGGTDGFGISHGCTTKNVLFEECTAYSNGSDGFDVSGKKGFGVTVIGCVAHHNGTEMWGVNFKCWNPGSKFVNCVAYATGKSQDGNFEALGDNITYINCTCGQNDDCGMKIRGKNIKLINCLFAGAKKKAVWLIKDEPDYSVVAENCLVSGGAPGDLAIGTNGNIQGDAQLVDPAYGDYRIKSGSAAAGKGKAVAGVSQDIAGKSRPTIKPAIGAYEAVENVPYSRVGQ